jgi:hypothetical protein
MMGTLMKTSDDHVDLTLKLLEKIQTNEITMNKEIATMNKEIATMKTKIATGEEMKYIIYYTQ